MVLYFHEANYQTTGENRMRFFFFFRRGVVEAKKQVHGTGSTALSKKKKKRHVINAKLNSYAHFLNGIIRERKL